MKRGFILLVAFLAIPLLLLAGDRTEQQMKDAAAKVLTTNHRRAGNLNDLKEFLALSKLKVYGYADGGFAVVTKDDRFDEVIGYSATKYSEAMPCGFQWWLETSNQTMENTIGQVTRRARASRAMKQEGVAALISTKWGQERPYNDKCIITADGKDYSLVTGCVATAMAQVMNYYKHPTKGKGENSYKVNYKDLGEQTYSANFENSTYDWNNMLDDYSNYRYSNTKDQHTEAVSQLMSDCGIAVNMKYTTYASSAYTIYIPIGLKNYFSYSFFDENKTIYNRSDYSNVDDWMDIIYTALNNNYPILYSGNKNKQDGHMFIIHGYDSDGKVIVNWGWNGDYDGAFMIDMLNPATGYSFNDMQQMIIPIPENSTIDPNDYKLTYIIDGDLFKQYKLKYGDAITPEPAPTKDGYTFSGWSNIPSTMPRHDVIVTGSFLDGSESANSTTVEIDGIYYNLIGKAKTAEVTSSPNNYSGDITIPGSVNYQGFTYQVTQIGRSAFYYCSNLTSVSIPSSVTKIGNSAFYYCSKLSSILLPNTIQDIGTFAFSGCSQLSSVTLPDGLTVLSQGMFTNCSGLKSISIPSTVTTIECNVFQSCSALESISLPSDLTDLGGTLGQCFIGCKSLTSVVIPDKVTGIGMETFANCTKLQTVAIGKSVKNINIKAFAECKDLSSVICYAENVPNTYSNAFDNSYVEHVTLYVPESAVSSYKSQQPWSKFGEIIGFTGKFKYTLTYKVDGEVYKTYQLEYGATITPETEPTKEGYTFSGWSEIPKTMPAHDVTVIGSFKRIYNVGDVTNVINFIMNGNATEADMAIYDMNHDGELNIGDVILIVKWILNNTSNSANAVIRRAGGIIDIRQFTAAQFEMKVPANVKVKDIRLVSSMMQSHQIMYRQMDEQTYAVVVYSPENQLFVPSNNNIVEVETESGESEHLTIQNAILAKPDGEVANYAGDFASTTGINQSVRDDEKPAVIYDLKGNRLENGNSLRKGLYIINGKKVVVK